MTILLKRTYVLLVILVILLVLVLAGAKATASHQLRGEERFNIASTVPNPDGIQLGLGVQT